MSERESNPDMDNLLRDLRELEGAELERLVAELNPDRRSYKPDVSDDEDDPLMRLMRLR